jgi:hypothetical protein
MLNVIMLSVIILNVMAPLRYRSKLLGVYLETFLAGAVYFSFIIGCPEKKPFCNADRTENR